jgi:hypothetical protein
MLSKIELVTTTKSNVSFILNVKQTEIVHVLPMHFSQD